MKVRQPDSTKLIVRLSPLHWFYKVVLRGDKVRCNVCGNTFERFRDFGMPKRKNAMCPHCCSLESSRLLWFYLSDEVLGKKNKNRFLYFQPESFIKNRLQEFNLDLSTVSLDYLRNLDQEEKYEKLPGGKADVIIFSHVLEFIADEELVFEELKRLLRPGGFVLIQTIVNWEMDRTYEHPKTTEDKDRLNQYFTPGVERIYGADFKKHLIRAGFSVEMIDYSDQLGIEANKYYCLGDGVREIIFKCKKQN